MSKNFLRLCLLGGAAVVLLALAAAPVLATGDTSAAKVALGALLAGDRSLSEPDGQACADCHLPAAGYAEPDQGLPVSAGVNEGDFGGRNAPTWAYTAWSPPLHFDGEAWVGGMFWDGRATGKGAGSLGSPLADQARGPFLNGIEMSNDAKSDVIAEVRAAPYAGLFRLVFGRNSLSNVDAAYDNVARAIAAYESSSLVNTFSSRYDAFVAGNLRALDKQEIRGLELFNDPTKGNCNACHPSKADPTISTGIASGKALFTDYTFDNLGIPKNLAFGLPPLNFNLGDVDLGLGGFLRDAGYGEDVAAAADGAFKVSTLRNLTRTAPYGHNGYFATLKDIVHFYNTAGDGSWPAPEVPVNVNRVELGKLRLTGAQEDDIVAFLRTLTDRVVVPIPLH